MSEIRKVEETWRRISPLLVRDRLIIEKGLRLLKVRPPTMSEISARARKLFTTMKPRKPVEKAKLKLWSFWERARADLYLERVRQARATVSGVHPAVRSEFEKMWRELYDLAEGYKKDVWAMPIGDPPKSDRVGEAVKKG